MSETQNVETGTKQFESRNSFEPPQASSIEPVAVPESSEPVNKAPQAVAPSEAFSENTEGELPEFAKRRLGKERKKHERELANMRAELEQARSLYGAASPSNLPPGQNGYRDPLTGDIIDTTTPEGQYLSSYHQKLSQKLTADEQYQQQLNQREVDAKVRAHVDDSVDEAREKLPDYDKVMRSSGINDSTARELGNFPDPAGLAYYLASNPREVNRIQNLPAYEMRRELARHMAEMVSKTNITRTPAPVNPVGATGVQSVKHVAHKTLTDLKAERKAHLSGSSRRR
jgi:hypothetical protein